MATKLHNDSRRHYSWWWVSHISPKNSKWLQENLADADMKVNAIIKLLEEDADSFARRAEMYYKKRPELMKLVEELYRAYRALAEKYDHATGALRQAHRTMAEAFPNQIPLLLSDESPCASSGSEAEPHTPEAPSPLRALFDPDDLTRDALGFSTELHVIKRNGAYSEPNDSLSNKKGLKQLNEMFEIGDGTSYTSEGRVRKGLHFQGGEEESLENKTLKCFREQNQVQEKPDVSLAIKGLEQDFSQLSAERENLKNQIMVETDRATKAVNELQSLKDTMSKLMIERDSDKSQYQVFQQRITVLESELSAANDELKQLNDEMARKVKKLQRTEEINLSLASEVEMLAEKAKVLEQELKQKKEELGKFHINIEEKHQICMEMEVTLHLKEKLYTQSQNKVTCLSQEIEKETQKLRDMELCNVDLQEEICKLKEEIDCLHEQNLHSTSMIKELKARITLLEEKNRALEEEVRVHIGEKDILNQEIFHVKDDKIDLQKKYQDLMGQKKAEDIHVQSLEMVIKSLQNENSELREASKEHEAEKVFLVEELKDKENILERNAVLENSLSDASIELKVLTERIFTLEDLNGSLNGEISTYVAEKKTLVSQLESLTQDVNILSEKNLFLEKSLSDINIEVVYLRSKSKGLEESSQLLSDQNSDLLVERNGLLGQIETLTQNVEKHAKKNSLLERSLSDVSSEVQLLKSKLAEFEESCQSLTDQNSEFLAERNTLLSQVKILTQNMEKLLEEKATLENSLYDVGSEVAGLRAKLKDTDEFCHSLSHQNSGLLAERNSLFTQVGLFTQNMENLSHRNESLEKSLSDLNKEVESLRLKLKDFEESCHSLNHQNSMLLAERSSLVSQVEVLTQNMEKLSQKNASLENSLSAVNNEVESLRSNLEHFKESCYSLSHQNSGLIAERSSLVSQVESFTQNMENLSNKNASLENSLSDVKNEVESLRSKLKDSEESCQSFRDQNSDLLAERNNILSELEICTQNMENLSGKNLLLEESLSCTRSEVCGLRSQLKDSEESCSTLSHQNSFLLTERSTLVSQVEALTQDVEKLSDKNSFLQDSVTDLGSEVECLMSKLKDFEESCQSLSNKNSNLLAERNTLESHVEVLTQNMEKLSQKNSILENSLSDASKDAGDLKSKLKEFEESYRSLSDQNSSLLAERSAIVSQAEVLAQKMEKLSFKNCSLENSLTATTTEVECLRFKLKDFEESCKSLSEKNSSILAEKNTLLSQVAILTQNAEKVSERNSFLESSLSELSTEVEWLRSKLKDSEESCESLSNQISDLLAERNNLISQVKVLTNNAENLSDKNSFLEVSLSNIGTEVECLRSKLKDSEDSFQSLSGQNSCLIGERNNLLSQLETTIQDKEKLLEKCSLLVNSLSHASTEVESLKLKLEDSKESFTSLTDQNFGLLAERSNLLSQVEVLTMDMENLSEMNSFFKNSLSDASSEVELLRSKLKDFKDSYQLLSDQNSSLLDERNAIISQLELLTQNAEKLSEKNSFLENSLSAVSTEVNTLRLKLKDFEESCQSLRSQNSSLLTERSTLVSQVESMTLNLESLEKSFLELKNNNFKMSEERDLITNQVKDLQDLLKLEKENHETLVQSCKSQLAALENQSFLLRQENQFKEQELKAEWSNLVDVLVENFVLQSCLCDVNSKNLALSIECQKNLQLCRNAEVLTSQLEQEKLIHIKNITTLSEQNQKLCNGICLLQNSLLVNKNYGFSDEIHSEVGLDTIVKDILTFVSKAEYDNQLLNLEISVLVTLLKHIMLDLVSLRFEKSSLEREVDNKTKELLVLKSKEHEFLGLHENLRKGLEASNDREIELKTEMKVLSVQLTDLQESLQASKCEIQNLMEEKNILMEEIYHLRQKHNILEEENREVLAEGMKLDHLCLFFRSLSAERSLELKSFAYDLDSLRFVKVNLLAEVDKLKSIISALMGENRHLMESLTCLEEQFRNHLLLSEFDLITSAWMCEELDLETHSTEKQLIQKQSQLSETNQKVKSTQLKNMELCKIIECLQLDIETGKLVKDGLEQKISNLSDTVAHNCEEIRCLCEANKMLKEEIYLKHGEVNILTSREVDLLSELKKEIDENERCEGEIGLFLSEIQISTLDAALYKEKFHELAIEEELCSMLQKEVLMMEIALIKDYVDNLKKKLDHLEVESRVLKVDLNVYASLVTSLWKGIISLEQQIVGMPRLGSPNDPDHKEVSHLHHDVCRPNEGHEGMNIGGVPALEKLITKVKFLQKVMGEIQADREQENVDGSNLAVTGKEIKRLEKKESGWQKSTGLSDDGINDAVVSTGKNGQTMKDIQLDQDSEQLPFRTIGSYGLSRINIDEIDDQLWEAAERNCTNRRPKASTVATEHDIEPAEEVKSEYPSSELMVEKELSIDKLEIPNKVLPSRQEWNKRLLSRLKTDAQRLSDLKTNVCDLKRKMEGSQMGKLPASFGYDTVKSQLKDAEVSAVELIDGNKKLTSRAEEYLTSDGSGARSEESSSSTGRRQLSEQARRESDKIGRLELELHKIQYVLLKLEEEQGSRQTNTTERRARTLLRDYIYGRRDGRGMKKRGLCGCMRPETKGNL